ncbi:MAG: calcium-binding protein, partial [Pseudomonadota bacterium]
MVVRYGGSGNDFITGSNAVDTIFGLNGDDRLYGLSANDSLFGGSGSDRLFGGEGSDTFFGATGNDTAFGADDGAASDTTRIRFFGGDGSDTLSANNTVGNLLFDGDDGDDRLTAAVQGSVRLNLDGGNDNATIFGSLSDLVIAAGSGLDFVRAGVGASGGTNITEISLTHSSTGRQTLFTYQTADEIVFEGGDGANFGGTGDSFFGYMDGSATFNLGEGGDRVSLFGDGELTVDLDGGNDIVNHTGSLTDLDVTASSGVDFFRVGAGASGGNNLSEVSVLHNATGRQTIIVNQTADVVNFRGGDGINFGGTGDSFVGFFDGSANFDLRNGSDRVTLFGDGELTVEQGGGNDAVNHTGSLTDLILTPSSGADFVQVGIGASGGDNLSEVIMLHNSTGRQTLVVNQTADAVTFRGGDGVNFGGTGDSFVGFVDGGATFDLGGGNDRVTLSGSLSDLTITDDSGFDFIRAGIGASGGQNITDISLEHGATGRQTFWFYQTTDELFFAGGDGANFGGTGDSLFGFVDGSATLDLGGGNDRVSLTGTLSDATIFGGSGSDRIVLSSSDTIGASSVTVSNDATGGSTLYLRMTTKELLFEGGDSNDTIFGAIRGSATVIGNDGNDRLEASPNLTASVSIFGGSGTDRIFGSDGDDTLRAGSGIDTVVYGQSGDDLFIVGAGEAVAGDVLNGGSGVDTLGLILGAQVPGSATLFNIEET